mgnify:CR=1 FL=1
MIPRTLPTLQVKSWQDELAELITCPEALFNLLELPKDKLADARRATQLFPLRCTTSFAARMQRGNLDDPLLRQVLPLGEELSSPPNFVDDPLEESDATPAPGLIHKYHGRVLMIAASQCAINCRYCFRRHFDYAHHTPNRQQWQQALDYIRQHEDVDEVILSGGDPLAVADKHLQWLVNEISAIPHVTRLRVHTRLPIVVPQRITDALAAILSGSRLDAVLVIHCNHAQEINMEVGQALNRLHHAGITLLNQSVLLRGVNDSTEALGELSKCLFRHKVLPYYLHLLDKVAGAAHFDVSEAQARVLYQGLLASLPGYLVPKMVKELPNTPSKVPFI